MVVSRYKVLEIVKRDVNVRRFNKIQTHRKLREASYIGYPRLVKGFHNRARLVVSNG